jgi:hypothetical protein
LAAGRAIPPRLRARRPEKTGPIPIGPWLLNYFGQGAMIRPKRPWLAPKNLQPDLVSALAASRAIAKGQAPCAPFWGPANVPNLPKKNILFSDSHYINRYYLLFSDWKILLNLPWDWRYYFTCLYSLYFCLLPRLHGKIQRKTEALRQRFPAKLARIYRVN